MASEDDGFDFIKEKIKDRPINKKRVLMKIGGTIGLAIIFGIVACLTFYALRPWAQERFTPVVEPDPIVLTLDEETESQTETAEPETEPESETEPKTTIIRETVELELEDVEKLAGKIREVFNEAQKSMVTVTGVTHETDMFNESSEKHTGEASGLIVADQGGELFIVTEYRVIQDAETVRVTFSDGTRVEATSLKYDGNTGFVVVKVPLGDLEENTRETIVTDALTRKSSAKQGDYVIALGSPLGYSKSYVTGMVTSISNSYTVSEQSETGDILTYDTDYSLLNTDIIGSSGGSGVLINLRGEVVGIISQKFSADSDRGLITGLSISQLIKLIENLSNDTAIPYLGIKGTEVTETMAAELGTPTGFHINSFGPNSPAAEVGIQSYDFIVSLNGQAIMTQADYKNVLAELEVGQVVPVIVKRGAGEGEYTEIPPYDVTVGVWQLE